MKTNFSEEIVWNIEKTIGDIKKDLRDITVRK